MSNLGLPISIADLLHGRSVEWERLEFKRGWNPEAVLHTICAFANDFHNLGGGYILLGVDERDGSPVLPPCGVSPGQLDAIQKEILQLGYQAIQPPYHPLTAPVEIDGRTILVIWAPGGETRPYKAKVSLTKESGGWAYYIRKQSSTIRAKGADERELIGLTATVPFDDRHNQSASLNDLSPRLIEEFLREVGSDLAEEMATLPMDVLGRQINIVGGPREVPFPKNVGLMFFNEHPELFFPATQIDVVWFPEGSGGDRFEEKSFKGPLARMVRDALGHIERLGPNTAVASLVSLRQILAQIGRKTACVRQVPGVGEPDQEDVQQRSEGFVVPLRLRDIVRHQIAKQKVEPRCGPFLWRFTHFDKHHQHEVAQDRQRKQTLLLRQIAKGIARTKRIERSCKPVADEPHDRLGKPVGSPRTVGLRQVLRLFWSAFFAGHACPVRCVRCTVNESR